MRVPTKSLNNKTPYEAYHGHKPELANLQEISSHTVVLILNKHNPKVFQCSKECVLIRYGKDSKSYSVITGQLTRCLNHSMLSLLSLRMTMKHHLDLVLFKVSTMNQPNNLNHH